MNIALLVITDGRLTCFEQAWRSLWREWRGPQPTAVVVVDDSGHPGYRVKLEVALRPYQTWLARRATHVISHDARLGFASAIDTGWRVLAGVAPDWVFHVEEDFLFNRPVPVSDMAAVLAAHPYLVQMSLMRQPVAPEEEAAGGLVAAHPAEFVDCTDGMHRWMEQRLYFTTNPSLYRGDFVRRGWPQVPQSEGKLTLQLLDHGFVSGGEMIPPQDVRFGVWGQRTDAPWVTHIGERIGKGY